jgi:hemerythrin
VTYSQPIAWTEEMRVGVELVDNQHKRLIELINSVENSLKLGQGRAIQGNLLRALAEYAKFHFSDEEALMQRIGYPELELQKEQHASFIWKVLEFNDGFLKHDALLGVEMMSYLKDWTVTHILQSDGRIGRFLESQGRPPER